MLLGVFKYSQIEKAEGEFETSPSVPLLPSTSSGGRDSKLQFFNEH
jgi:hypothetical protein